MLEIFSLVDDKNDTVLRNRGINKYRLSTKKKKFDIERAA